MPAAKMIGFHKSAQDGWLQKQLFLHCSFAAAGRVPLSRVAGISAQRSALFMLPRDN
jgi:hypothetical protein